MSATSPRTLPAPLGALLGRLPAWPGSALLATLLNAALLERLPADVRQRLAGRTVRIRVRDARLTFDFCCERGRFAACPPGGPAELSISAAAHDFLLLAQRRADPDTLFFSRRLSMEGDTELGLAVKNALDALELPPLDPRQWKLVQVLNSLAPHARRPGIGPRQPKADE